jgi:hypothetical protein
MPFVKVQSVNNRSGWSAYIQNLENALLASEEYVLDNKRGTLLARE